MTPNQVKSRLKAHILSGKTITSLQALERWGTMRIAVYVNRLRQDGVKIRTTMVTKGKKTFAEYSAI
jgi:hypothetical protein